MCPNSSKECTASILPKEDLQIINFTLHSHFKPNHLLSPIHTGNKYDIIRSFGIQHCITSLGFSGASNRCTALIFKGWGTLQNFKMSGNTNPATHHHILEEMTPQHNHCGNPESHMVNISMYYVYPSCLVLAMSCDEKGQQTGHFWNLIPPGEWQLQAPVPSETQQACGITPSHRNSFAEPETTFYSIMCCNIKKRFLGRIFEATFL